MSQRPTLAALLARSSAGLLGLFYPPLILITAAAGGGVARAAAHLWHGVSRKDIAELGALIDSGEGAVMVIASKLPSDVESVLPHATQHRASHDDAQARRHRIADRRVAAGRARTQLRRPPRSSRLALTGSKVRLIELMHHRWSVGTA